MKYLQATTTKYKLSPRFVAFIVIVAAVLTTLYIGILLATVSSSTTGSTDTGQSNRPAIAAAKPQTQGESSNWVDSNSNSDVSSVKASSNNQSQNMPSASRSNQSRQTSNNQPGIQWNGVKPNTEQQNNNVVDSLVPGLVSQPETEDTTIDSSTSTQDNGFEGGGLLDDDIIQANEDNTSSEMIPNVTIDPQLEPNVAQQRPSEEE